jgi:hypothetical protein
LVATARNDLVNFGFQEPRKRMDALAVHTVHVVHPVHETKTAARMGGRFE